MLIENHDIYIKAISGAHYHQINLMNMAEVQEFLQNMDDRESRPESSPSIPEDQDEVSATSQRHESEMARYNRSWNSQDKNQSDSGISVHSSSPDQDSTTSEEEDDSEQESEGGHVPAPQPPGTGWDRDVAVPEHYYHQKALADPDPMVQRLQDQEKELREHILHSPQPIRFSRHAVSAPYEPPPSWNPYGSHMMHGPPGYPYNLYPSESFPPAFQHTENENEKPSSKNETVKAGYELIASKLSEEYNASTNDSIRPLYRRFEQLNHRILLHLQDEIAELEEEVQQLDQKILQLHSGFDEDQHDPQSRRYEAQFGSEIHFRRTELLGKVFVKLGQYNTAMEAYRSAFVCGTSAADHPGMFSQPSKSEVDRYRSWMRRNAPIAATEAKFLQNEADLVALPKRSTVDHSHRSFTALETCMIALIPVPIVVLCMWVFF